MNDDWQPVEKKVKTDGSWFGKIRDGVEKTASYGLRSFVNALVGPLLLLNQAGKQPEEDAFGVSHPSNDSLFTPRARYGENGLRHIENGNSQLDARLGRERLDKFKRAAPHNIEQQGWDELGYDQPSYDESWRPRSSFRGLSTSHADHSTPKSTSIAARKRGANYTAEAKENETFSTPIKGSILKRSAPYEIEKGNVSVPQVRSSDTSSLPKEKKSVTFCFKPPLTVDLSTLKSRKRVVTTALQTLPRRGDRDWVCSMCSQYNHPMRTRCGHCFTSVNFISPLTKNSWKCAKCCYRNASTLDECLLCRVPKSGKYESAASASDQSNLANEKSKYWQCNTCLITNAPGRVRCCCCSTLRTMFDSTNGHEWKTMKSVGTVLDEEQPQSKRSKGSTNVDETQSEEEVVARDIKKKTPDSAKFSHKESSPDLYSPEEVSSEASTESEESKNESENEPVSEDEQQSEEYESESDKAGVDEDNKSEEVIDLCDTDDEEEEKSNAQKDVPEGYSILKLPPEKTGPAPFSFPSTIVAKAADEAKPVENKVFEKVSAQPASELPKPEPVFKFGAQLLRVEQSNQGASALLFGAQTPTPTAAPLFPTKVEQPKVAITTTTTTAETKEPLFQATPTFKFSQPSGASESIMAKGLFKFGSSVNAPTDTTASLATGESSLSIKEPNAKAPAFGTTTSATPFSLNFTPTFSAGTSPMFTFGQGATAALKSTESTTTNTFQPFFGQPKLATSQSTPATSASVTTSFGQAPVIQPSSASFSQPIFGQTSKQDTTSNLFGQVANVSSASSFSSQSVATNLSAATTSSTPVFTFGKPFESAPRQFSFGQQAPLTAPAPSSSGEAVFRFGQSKAPDDKEQTLSGFNFTATSTGFQWPASSTQSAGQPGPFAFSVQASASAPQLSFGSGAATSSVFSNANPPPISNAAADLSQGQNLFNAPTSSSAQLNSRRMIQAKRRMRRT